MATRLKKAPRRPFSGTQTTPEKRSETDLKCSVCLDLYQDPLLLPCLHAYCKKCLEGLLRKGKPSTKRAQILTCPQCRKGHTLPESGVSGFPSDQVLANEVQAHALKTGVKNSSDVKQKQCTMCTEDDPATNYCATCGKYLCDFCHKAHKRQVDFRSHKITSLSELGPEDILAMEKPLHCRSHAGEVLKLYCRTCNKLICRDCTIVDHRSHEYGFNCDLRPAVQKEVTSTSTALKKKQQDFECHKALIQMAEKEYEEYSTDLEKDITTTFNGYIKQMEAHRDKLLQQVQASKQTDMKQIWAQKEFIETTLSGIANALRYADRLCGCTSDTVMLAMRSEATVQFDSLQSSHWDATKLQLSTPRVFQKSNPQIKASGQLNEIPEKMVNISVTKKLQHQNQHDLYQYYGGYRQTNETISLGDKVVLTVQSNYTKPVLCFSPPVTITMNGDYGYNQEFKSFTFSYEKKGQWTLEILPTQSGRCDVTSKPKGTILYSIQVSGLPMKVGSRVRRGPNWKSGDDDGGDGSEGMVTSSTASQQQYPHYHYGFQVCVKWSKTGKTGNYQFDEEQCVFEIELIPLGL